MNAWRMLAIPNLLSILLTNKILLQAKKEGQDIPTARAISERLTKIKNIAKGGKNGAATPKGTPTKATPRKRAAGKTTTPGSKRSRTKVIDDSSPGSPNTVKDESEVKNEPKMAIKQEEDGEKTVKNQAPEDVFAGGKRVRTAPALPLGMVRYEFDTDDDDEKYESSVSEYAPVDFVTPAVPNENGSNGAVAEYA